MHNPWMSMWLSAANSWANAVQGAWMAEMHRQQRTMAEQMVRQTMDFWTGAWMSTPIAGPKSKRRP